MQCAAHLGTEAFVERLGDCAPVNFWAVALHEPVIVALLASAEPVRFCPVGWPQLEAHAEVQHDTLLGGMIENHRFCADGIVLVRADAFTVLLSFSHVHN